MRDESDPLRPLFAGDEDRDEFERPSKGAREAESMEVCGWREGDRPRPPESEGVDGLEPAWESDFARIRLRL